MSTLTRFDSSADEGWGLGFFCRCIHIVFLWFAIRGIIITIVADTKIMNSWRYWPLFCYQRVSLDDNNGYATKFSAFFIAMVASKPFNDLLSVIPLFQLFVSQAKIFTSVRIK